MRINLGLERFFDNGTDDSFHPMDINIANNPSMNNGLLDTIINNGTLNNYSDQELYDLLSNNLRGLLLNIFESVDNIFSCFSSSVCSL